MQSEHSFVIQSQSLPELIQLWTEDAIRGTEVTEAAHPYGRGQCNFSSYMIQRHVDVLWMKIRKILEEGGRKITQSSPQTVHWQEVDIRTGQQIAVRCRGS